MLNLWSFQDKSWISYLCFSVFTVSYYSLKLQLSNCCNILFPLSCFAISSCCFYFNPYIHSSWRLLLVCNWSFLSFFFLFSVLKLKKRQDRFSHIKIVFIFCMYSRFELNWTDFGYGFSWTPTELQNGNIPHKSQKRYLLSYNNSNVTVKQ